MGISALYGYFAEKLEGVFHANQTAIEDAAQVMSHAYQTGHTIFAFGSGHSALLVEEMYYRAGGLPLITPIWDFDVMIHRDPLRASALERTPGYASTVLQTITWQPGDVLWLISNSGRNALVVEMARMARGAGVTVMALTSLRHSRAVQPGDAQGDKLFELADVVLDNCGVLGDAGFLPEGVDRPMAPTSTVLGAVLVHAVEVRVMEHLAQAGVPPEVLRSFNVDDPSPAGACGA